MPVVPMPGPSASPRRVSAAGLAAERSYSWDFCRRRRRRGVRGSRVARCRRRSSSTRRRIACARRSTTSCRARRRPRAGGRARDHQDVRDDRAHAARRRRGMVRRGPESRARRVRADRRSAAAAAAPDGRFRRTPSDGSCVARGAAAGAGRARRRGGDRRAARRVYARALALKSGELIAAMRPRGRTGSSPRDRARPARAGLQSPAPAHDAERGLLCDARASITSTRSADVARPHRVFPLEIGEPGEPKDSEPSRIVSHASRIAMPQVCQPLAISPFHGLPAARSGRRGTIADRSRARMPRSRLGDRRGAAMDDLARMEFREFHRELPGALPGSMRCWRTTSTGVTAASIICFRPA